MNYSERIARDIQNPVHARAMLAGLLVECPLGCNTADCQLDEMRQLPASEKAEWLFSLADGECVQLYKSHLTCLGQKEGEMKGVG